MESGSRARDAPTWRNVTRSTCCQHAHTSHSWFHIFGHWRESVCGVWCVCVCFWCCRTNCKQIDSCLTNRTSFIFAYFGFGVCVCVCDMRVRWVSFTRSGECVSIRMGNEENALECSTVQRNEDPPLIHSNACCMKNYTTVSERSGNHFSATMWQCRRESRKKIIWIYVKCEHTPEINRLATVERKHQLICYNNKLVCKRAIDNCMMKKKNLSIFHFEFFLADGPRLHRKIQCFFLIRFASVPLKNEQKIAWKRKFKIDSSVTISLGDTGTGTGTGNDTDDRWRWLMTKHCHPWCTLGTRTNGQKLAGLCQTLFLCTLDWPTCRLATASIP